MIEEAPNNFLMTSSIFEKNQDSLSEQLRFFSSEEASMLSEKIKSDKQKINGLNKVAEDLTIEEKNFSWTGQWMVTGTVGIFGLSYEGQINFNADVTYEARGNLDGKSVSGDGTFLINEQLGTCTLFPFDSEPTQYSFVDIGNNSFIMWSPLDFENLEFHKMIS